MHTNQQGVLKMAAIVTQTADNAYRMRDVFRAANRDCYPLGVYQAIYDFTDIGDEAYGENGAYHLNDLDGFNVIAWCRGINTFTFDDLDDLAYRLCDENTVLYVDEDTKTVYYQVY